MSELWDRMTEAMVNETIENPFYQEADLLRAALTVAAEYGQDHSLDECYPSQASCQMAITRDAAERLLSLAATGGDNE